MSYLTIINVQCSSTSHSHSVHINLVFTVKPIVTTPSLLLSSDSKVQMAPVPQSKGRADASHSSTTVSAKVNKNGNLAKKSKQRAKAGRSGTVVSANIDKNGRLAELRARQQRAAEASNSKPAPPNPLKFLERFESARKDSNQAIPGVTSNHPTLYMSRISRETPEIPRAVLTPHEQRSLVDAYKSLLALRMNPKIECPAHHCEATLDTDDVEAMKRHFSEFHKTYPCPDCEDPPVSFPTEHDLHMHFLEIHEHLDSDHSEEYQLFQADKEARAKRKNHLIQLHREARAKHKMQTLEFYRKSEERWDASCKERFREIKAELGLPDRNSEQRHGGSSSQSHVGSSSQSHVEESRIVKDFDTLRRRLPGVESYCSACLKRFPDKYPQGIWRDAPDLDLQMLVSFHSWSRIHAA